MTVLAFEPRNNAELMQACVSLGIIRATDAVLDTSYGLGRFWTNYRPTRLTTNDLFTPADHAHDFTNLPDEWARAFDVTVFDPPYKLNGTPSMGGPASSDVDYGVGKATKWQDRHALINAGIRSCAATSKRHLLIKCQDQVCSGAVRWQTHEFAATAAEVGFALKDKLHVPGHRPQPETRPCKACGGSGRVMRPNESPLIRGHLLDPCANCDGAGRIKVEQEHAARNYSTLLVCKRKGGRG